MLEVTAMNFWMTICVLGLNVTAATFVHADTIGDKVSWQGHDYYLLDGKDWWAQEAEAVSLGGHLVTVNDEDEHYFIWNTFNNYEGGSRYIWIGFTDSAVEGSWEWTSGEPVTYTRWAGGEPNNSPNSDAAYISSPNDPRPFYWNDAPTSWGLNAVAEVVPSSVPEPSISAALLSLGLMGLIRDRRRRVRA
jgi:hypothetical protein